MSDSEQQSCDEKSSENTKTPFLPQLKNKKFEEIHKNIALAKSKKISKVFMVNLPRRNLARRPLVPQHVSAIGYPSSDHSPNSISNCEALEQTNPFDLRVSVHSNTEAKSVRLTKE